MGISAPTSASPVGALGTVRTWLQTARVAATSSSAASGLLTIDTIVLVAGDRVLLTSQAEDKDNGVYVAASGAWARAADMAAGETIEPTAHVPISEGATHEDSTYQITTDGTITVDTDAVTFAKIALGIAAVVDDETPELGGDLDCDTKSVTNASEVGIGVAVPRRKLDVLDATDPQLRLSRVDNTNYVDLHTTAGDNLLVESSSGTSFYNITRGPTNVYAVYQASGSSQTVDGAGKGLSVGVTGNTAYIWMIGGGEAPSGVIKIGCASANAITIDANNNTTAIQNLLTNGNVTLGDAGTDEHTLNGTLNLDSAPADETCSGTTATFQAGEGVNRGDVVYYKPADSKMYKADADLPATSRAVAIAAEDVVLDGTGRFLMQGFVKDVGTFAGAYTAGDVLYTHTTGGPPTKTAPSGTGDSVQVIGWAVDTNTIYFDPSSTIIEIA